jgi:putative addiction module component (TIGR02574 family)
MCDKESLTPEQEEELEQRLAEYDADPLAGSSWEEVRARIEQKLALD